MAICELESGGNPQASNWRDSHDGCNGSFGLMQIGCVHGHDREALYDPEANIAIAYSLYISLDKNGEPLHFRPWSTYTKLLASR